MNDSSSSGSSAESGKQWGGMSRRDVLQRGAGVGLALTLPGLLAACGGGSGGTAPAIQAPTGSSLLTDAPGGTPRRGGRLIVAYVGGGAAETLDPNLYAAAVDIARGLSLWSRLTWVNPDLEVENELAENFEHKATYDEWTIRLRPGVKFHDGSDLTVDDVLFTLARASGAKSSSPGKTILTSTMDLKGARKLDPLTVRIPLLRPFVDFPAIFSDYWMVILKNGTTDFQDPVGTGPFKYAQFSPGSGSLFTRFDDYWRHGQPYLDELEFQSIPDGGTRLSALQSGQVDAMELVTFTQARENVNATNMRVLVGRGPVNTPVVMPVDRKPFEDVRLRQALRLMVDRPALVNSVQSGFGEVGNDLYGKGLKYYAADIPQRTQDVEQAKALLKKAGMSNLKVTISTAPLWPGALESAQVIAEQVKESGVQMEVEQLPAENYFADAYGKKPLFQSNWQAQPIPTWFQTALTKGGLYNETDWDVASFTKLMYDAQGTADPGKAQDKWTELQRINHDQSGYVLWGFYPYLDGISPKVHGAHGSGWAALSAANYREWWLQ